MNTENKKITVGSVVNWRSNGGHGIVKPQVIKNIELCEVEGDKYGITVPEAWAKDKDRCVFDLDNGKFAYGHQIDLIEENLIPA